MALHKDGQIIHFHKMRAAAAARLSSQFNLLLSSEKA